MKNANNAVAVVGGIRIPFCRQNSGYATKSNQDMLTATLQGLVQKYGLQGERLGEVVGGAVLKHSRDYNLVRECTLSSGLALETPAHDLQQACDTGVQAAITIANKIATGQIEAGIACGVDTTSDAPIAVSEPLRHLLLSLARSKKSSERLRLLSQLRPSHLRPLTPAVVEARTKLSMGQHTEIMAKEWHISREAQDALAFESHQKAARAYESGFYADLLVPYAGVHQDNNLRLDVSLQRLAQLKPAFDREHGTLTAGNSTPLSDGASAVLLASEAWARSNGHKPQAYVIDAETAAVDYVRKKEGLLMAPVYAVPRMLQRNGLKLQDFDFYEIHEAFSAQVLCTLQAWEDPVFCTERLGLDKPLGSVDRAKMNLRGGSVALGHPFAATGGRIIATMAKIIDEAGGGRGLISICAAGGQGVVMILARD